MHRREARALPSSRPSPPARPVSLRPAASAVGPRARHSSAAWDPRGALPADAGRRSGRAARSPPSSRSRGVTLRRLQLGRSRGVTLRRLQLGRSRGVTLRRLQLGLFLAKLMASGHPTSLPPPPPPPPRWARYTTPGDLPGPPPPGQPPSASATPPPIPDLDGACAGRCCQRGAVAAVLRNPETVAAARQVLQWWRRGGGDWMWVRLQATGSAVVGADMAQATTTAVPA